MELIAGHARDSALDRAGPNREARGPRTHRRKTIAAQEPSRLVVIRLSEVR
jgi:hypothetical protein